MQAYTLFVLCALVGTAYSNRGQPSRPGGVGEIKKADADVKKAVNAVSSALASNTKSSANTKFEPVEYATQTVAGTNYFVKIRVPSRNGFRFVLARIFKSLDGKTFKLDGFKNIGDTDPVEYMDAGDFPTKCRAAFC